jgi:hypothetical protein
MHVVTMVQIDEARNKLNGVIQDLRSMQGQGYLPRLYAEVAAYRDYCQGEVGKLLAAYHQQRSPAFLLGLLRHSRECADLFLGEGCEECEVIRLLAKEAP